VRETLGAETIGVLLNLLQAHSVLTEALEARLRRERGVSLAEHELLARLAAAPLGRLRMLDLSQLLLVSKSGVTRLVDRLEKSGLVTREDSPRDRRVIYALITPSGRRVARASGPVFVEGIRAHFASHLSEPDVRALQRALRRILAGNGQWDEARCCPPFAERQAGRGNARKVPVVRRDDEKTRKNA
jgi:DNA-binding MarR family transcriptional regulator